MGINGTEAGLGGVFKTKDEAKPPWVGRPSLQIPHWLGYGLIVVGGSRIYDGWPWEGVDLNLSAVGLGDTNFFQHS